MSWIKWAPGTKKTGRGEPSSEAFSNVLWPSGTRLGKGDGEKPATQKRMPAKKSRLALVKPRGQLNKKKISTQSLLLVFLLVLTGVSGIFAWREARQRGFFEVKRIFVEGNRRIEAVQILEAAGLDIGSDILNLGLKNVEARIMELPGIQRVSVYRSWGGTVRVSLIEDIPVARSASNFEWVLFADGRIAKASALELDLPWVEGLPQIKPERRAELGLLLATLSAKAPDLIEHIAQIEVLDREAFAYWRDGRFRLRFALGDKSLNSLDFFRELLAKESSQWVDGATVDLRVEGYAYVL